jgi:integrase
LEPDERDRLIRACVSANDHLLLSIAVLAELGFRVGELRALHWGEVDLRHRTVSVEWTTRVRLKPDDQGVTEEGPPKSTASRRTLRLPQFLTDALRRVDAPEEKSLPWHLVWPGQPAQLVPCMRQDEKAARVGETSSDLDEMRNAHTPWLPGSAFGPALYRGLMLAKVDRFLCLLDRSEVGLWKYDADWGRLPSNWQRAPVCPKCKTPHSAVSLARRKEHASGGGPPSRPHEDHPSFYLRPRSGRARPGDRQERRRSVEEEVGLKGFPPPSVGRSSLNHGPWE